MIVPPRGISLRSFLIVSIQTITVAAQNAAGVSIDTNIRVVYNSYIFSFAKKYYCIVLNLFKCKGGNYMEINWFRIGIDPWILQHPIIAEIILSGLLILAILLLISERRSEAKGA
jgi:hypothetical protein